MDRYRGLPSLSQSPSAGLRALCFGGYHVPQSWISHASSGLPAQARRSGFVLYLHISSLPEGVKPFWGELRLLRDTVPFGLPAAPGDSSDGRTRRSTPQKGIPLKNPPKRSRHARFRGQNKGKEARNRAFSAESKRMMPCSCVLSAPRPRAAELHLSFASLAPAPTDRIGIVAATTT